LPVTSGWSGLEPADHQRHHQTCALVLIGTSLLAIAVSFLSLRLALWALAFNFAAPLTGKWRDRSVTSKRRSGAIKALITVTKRSDLALFPRKATWIIGYGERDCCTVSMSAKDFLNQRAVNISVNGHYKIGHWYDALGKPRTFACRTSRVSPFRMMVMAPVVGKVGDPITSYFGDFGKLNGLISEIVNGGFLLELDMPRAMREKLSDKLTWLEKKQKDPSIRDVREQARIIPVNPHSILTFADGTTRSCFVIDMSASGAAVSADIQPEIGMPLAVGACVGRVVRIFPNGFAVKFVERQNRDELERRVARAPYLHSAGLARTGPRSHDAAGDMEYDASASPW
jgi:hypothetical protein